MKAGGSGEAKEGTWKKNSARFEGDEGILEVQSSSLVQIRFHPPVSLPFNPPDETAY